MTLRAVLLPIKPVRRSELRIERDRTCLEGETEGLPRQEANSTTNLVVLLLEVRVHLLKAGLTSLAEMELTKGFEPPTL